MLVPPNWDMRYIECFGFTLEDIGEEGATSLETKMRTAGMPIEELPGPPVFPVQGTPRERAERGKQMVRAGSWARRRGRRHGPGDMRMLFEAIAGGLDSQRRGRARHDPVGLPRRRALARGRGQRRHPCRAGPRGSRG